MKENTKTTLLIYWQHVCRYWPAFLVIVLGTAIASSTDIVVSHYFKQFFDVLDGSPSGDTIRHELIRALLLISCWQLVGWLLWRTAGFTYTNYLPRVMEDLSNTAFKYLHGHSFAFFSNNFVGSLVKKLNRFVWSFDGLFEQVVWTLLPMSVTTILTFIILGLKNKWLGLGLILWTIVFLTITIAFTKFKLRYDIKRNEAETITSGFLADTVSNQASVKLFGGFRRETEKYAETNREVRRLSVWSWSMDSLFDAIQSLMMIALEFAIFFSAIGLWQKGVITLGDFALIQILITSVIFRIWDLGRSIRHIYQELANAEEMTVIFKTHHEIKDAAGAKKLSVTNGKIEFQKIDFTYPNNKTILTDFNLTIQPHERLALVGRSGAGKSTIMHLLLRLYGVKKGQIMIDGQDISQVTLESLWQNLSLVPQDTMLFHRTIMENIRYGLPQATDAEARLAATAAHCDEFISTMEQGYNTKVGERGIKLSGGERQRIAIARAILRNAPILILDEATSSLDSESERLIQDALDNLMRGKTVIAIAHRLSTIMKMDRIVVMENGQIVEEGKHEDLIKKKSGIYQKLWQIQAGGFIQ